MHRLSKFNETTDRGTEGDGALAERLEGAILIVTYVSATAAKSISPIFINNMTALQYIMYLESIT
jgi:hypothetical protein